MGDIEALYIAYTLLWAGLLGYLLYLHIRQGKLLKEIELLKEMVKKNEGE